MSARDIEDVYGLTPMQHGMLFENLYSPGEGTYIEQSVLTLHGNLNSAHFWDAWRHVRDRHPCLRTTFHWNDIKNPVQTVHREIDFERTEVDLREDSELDQRAEIAEHLRDSRARGFDIEAAPPISIRLYRTSDEEHKMVLNLHHLIMDGWSVGIVLGEFMQSYQAYQQGLEPELPRAGTYRDYVGWWREHDTTEAERYWRNQLAGARPPQPLDLGTPPPVEPGAVAYDWADLDLTELVDDVRAFTREHQITAHTLLQGAWSLVMSRCGNTEDITVGTTFAHRPREVPSSESVVGCMVCTVPIHTSVVASEPVTDYLRTIQSAIVGARDHAAADLVDIHAWSPVPRSRTLFESVVTHQNIPIPDFASQGGELSISDYFVDTRPQLPLLLMILPGSTLPLRLVHDSRRFSARQAWLLLCRVRHTIAAIVRGGSTDTVGEIDVCPPEERERLAEVYAQPDNVARLTAADSPVGQTLGVTAQRETIRLVDERQREVPLGSPGLPAATGDDGTVTLAHTWARVTDEDTIEFLAGPAAAEPAVEIDENRRTAHTATERRIAELMADILDLEYVDPSENLIELGMHSMLGTRVVTQIRNVWNIAVSLRTLFERPTVAEIAHVVEAGGEAGSTPRSRANLADEVRLDPSISGEESRAWPCHPSHVFLTGATGFLGVSLLERLLSTTTATVTCLVRPTTGRDGRARVHDALRDAGLWDEEFAPRIAAVSGDLSKPLLGMSETAFKELGNDVDEIYHAGASTNVLARYRRLRSTNVNGTHEVIRLATTGGTKPVHYVSPAELSEHPDPAKSGLEQPVEATAPESHNGYDATQWVCERLLALANERGVPTVVYRAARLVGGHTRMYWKPTDITSEILQACASLNLVPATDMPLPCSPVDYVATAICALARDPESSGQHYHLVSPEPFTFNLIGQAMTAAGYPVRSVDLDTWYAELVRRLAELRVRHWDMLLSVVGEWKLMANCGQPEPDYRSTTAQRALRRSGSADITCQPTDTDYLRRSIRHFQQAGTLSPPVEATVGEQT